MNIGKQARPNNINSRDMAKTQRAENRLKKSKTNHLAVLLTS